MKNIFIAALAGAAIILGAFLFLQHRRASEDRSGEAQLREQLQNAQSALQAQKDKAGRLERKLTASEVKAQFAAQKAELAARGAPKTGATAADSSSQGKTNGFASALSEMLKDPDTKAMIKSQQKNILGASIEQGYGKLFSNLKLAPEQTAKLKDLLLDKQLDTAGAALSMMSGDADPDKRAQIAQEIKAATDANDAKIKDFLGEDNFSQLKEYEKTLSERTTVSSFKDQLGAANPLTDAQEESLVNMMAQEKKNFKSTVNLDSGSDPAKASENLSTMMSEEKLTQALKNMDQLNQSYIAQSGSILTPEQSAAFEKYLNGQMALQKASVQMAAKMFSK